MSSACWRTEQVLNRMTSASVGSWVEFVALAAQAADDQLAVEHVHLAADGFDVESFGAVLHDEFRVAGYESGPEQKGRTDILRQRPMEEPGTEPAFRWYFTWNPIQDCRNGRVAANSANFFSIPKAEGG